VQRNGPALGTARADGWFPATRASLLWPGAAPLFKSRLWRPERGGAGALAQRYSNHDRTIQSGEIGRLQTAQLVSGPRGGSSGRDGQAGSATLCRGGIAGPLRVWTLLS